MAQHEISRSVGNLTWWTPRPLDQGVELGVVSLGYRVERLDVVVQTEKERDAPCHGIFDRLCERFLREYLVPKLRLSIVVGAFLPLLVDPEDDRLSSHHDCLCYLPSLELLLSGHRPESSEEAQGFLELERLHYRTVQLSRCRVQLVARQPKPADGGHDNK
jgi:hypothetical protein